MSRSCVWQGIIESGAIPARHLDRIRSDSPGPGEDEFEVMSEDSFGESWMPVAGREWHWDLCATVHVAPRQFRLLQESLDHSLVITKRPGGELLLHTTRPFRQILTSAYSDYSVVRKRLLG